MEKKIKVQKIKPSYNKKSSHKIIAIFLTINFLNALMPYNLLYGGTNGPSSSEASGFEPVDATDMVNLATGDLAYVLPLLDVDGFPVNLSYHAGITQDLDASWVGLGWYLNPGAINRTVTNTPDDWKEGVGINFTSYAEAASYYGITVDFGFPTGPSVGAGLNWGGGKGLSGSVSASMSLFKLGGMVDAVSVSGSASSTGTVGAGVSVASAGSGSSSVGAGASVAYNLNSKETSAGVGVGVMMQGGSYVGASYSTSGFGISAGQNYRTTGVGETNSGVGMSSNSFSSGDYSIDQQSMAVAIPLHALNIPLTLGFSHTKVKYSLRKGFKNRTWGALYSSEWASIIENGQVSGYNNEFTDYQKRTKSMDIYSTRLPQPEKEFVADNSKDIENINFTFIAYDDYNVNAQGISGAISPRILQESIVFGKGERTQNSDGEDIHAFYHYGKNEASRITQRKFGKPLIQGSPDYDDLYFYFEGQINSRDKVINSNTTTSNLGGGYLEFNDLLTGGGFESNFSQPRGRSMTPSYIQVFTNYQIAKGYAKSKGLISPKGIIDKNRLDEDLFDPDGIGAYMITSPDGKTYHFSLPVYHYERVFRDLIKDPESNVGFASNVSEKRQYSKYATHWLLTAVTGSDYFNNTSAPDSEGLDKTDYGYWVELEYGKWSDGFVWRSPYESNTYDYNSNLTNDIGDKDKGHYSFGRKQLYYLDKIKTRNKTAIFVKNIRKDAVGQNLKFAFNADSDAVDVYTGNLKSSGGNNYLNQTSDSIQVRESGVSYKTEYNLNLEKIILLQTEVADSLSKSTGSGLGMGLPDMDVLRHNPNWESTDFKSEYRNGDNYFYDLHMQNNVFDVYDIDDNFIKANALKIVELDHSYRLAKNSPSSPKSLHGTDVNGNYLNGKLTLERVYFKGKGGEEYMPPYQFSYHAPDWRNISPSDFTGSTSKELYLAKKNAIDNWGFLKGNYFTQKEGSEDLVMEANDLSKAWSLKSIKMPTGASIEIEYEKDDYYIEAFSRRFWQDGLQFSINNIGTDNTGFTGFEIVVKKDELSINDPFDFRDYFDESMPILMDFWLCVWDNDTFTNTDKERIDVSADYKIENFTVNENSLSIKLTYANLIELDDSGDLFGHTFRKNSSIGSEHPYELSQRNICWSGTGSGGDGFNLYYKLLANKVPENQIGGGLRVSKLTTKESFSKEYIVEYNYDFPQNHELAGRSSGITSYAPVGGLNYVPYQSEVPAPGVMYEYVTMTEKNMNNEHELQTRYRFNVLKPVFNIFSENITMEAMENENTQDDIFSVKVQTLNSLDGNNSKKVSSKTIDVYNNTALLGQIKSIETFNEEGHLIYMTENQFINGGILSGDKPNRKGNYVDQDLNKGYVKETFNSLKSIFTTNSDGSNPQVKNRLLSISSKTDYNNMLKKVTTISGGHTGSITYLDVDPWLGSFRKSKTTLSDGSVLISERLPAYEKYSGMQSKAFNELNKNMLSQQALAFTYLEGGGITDASLTTWQEAWNYSTGSNGLTPGTHNAWRKHKEYIWKDVLNPDGTYATNLKSNDNFNWNSGLPSTGAEDNWLKISEISQYSPLSSPIETIDINGNRSAVLWDIENRNVLASANAAHSEIFYAGAEEVFDASHFNNKIMGAQYRTNIRAHTGNYSVKNNNPGDKVFEVALGQLSNTTVSPGYYKVSYWTSNDPGHENSAIYFNNNTVPASESIEAGCWVLKNHYINYTGGELNLHVTNSTNSGHYFDDFRMHPVQASMNSFVYDPGTAELLYALDGNNMGMAFRYDAAGRIQVSYKEVPNDHNFEGGFKVINKMKYQYKNLPLDSSFSFPDNINNCSTQNISL